MEQITWYSTTQSESWKKKSYSASEKDTISNLQVKCDADQKMDGFGACFNELCEIALRDLSPEDHEKVLDLLYSPDADGLRLSYCRMPIGASDYAESWYSHNETAGDYEMENFSIERDYRYLLPMIRDAYKRRPDMRLFASPWSPPVWMKNNGRYNGGNLLEDEKTLRAYALYFAKFVEAYEKEGVHIDAIHVQNEPFADQVFPSCLWSGELFIKFIGRYMGPLFKERGLSTEIFLGTMNSETSETYNGYINGIFCDPDASEYVAGIGMQWAGKYLVPYMHESWPDVYTVQTENECGNGENSWGYARYIFDLFHHYLSNGVRAYTYWNPILRAGGVSTWGWAQNSMITVEGGKYRLCPEFYVMKHFSHFVQRGAQRLVTGGHWTSNSIVFRNPDGSKVIVMQNPFAFAHTVKAELDGKTYSFELEPDSFNTVVIE